MRDPDRKMVRQLKRRKEKALDTCILQYGSLLKTVIARRLFSRPEDVEEVLNDVFLKIWNNISYFDPEKGTFRQWICAVADYAAIDRLRQAVNEDCAPLTEGLPGESETPEETLLRKELYQGLRQYLDYLNPEDREIFYSLFFQNESYEDVAKKYGIKTANLYNRVSRGRKVLRERRKNDEEKYL